LTQIHLERFKAAFKPQPIEFRSFNVIVGRNGAGKSTLLEALQWIDTALRHDIRQACAPYNGVRDLVNLRSRSKVRFFRVALSWDSPSDVNARLHYDLKVRESEDETRPEVDREHLAYSINSSQQDIISTANGLRFVVPSGKQEAYRFADPDRLALSVAAIATKGPIEPRQRYLDALRSFWHRAVFLRLSPLRIAQGPHPLRKAGDPLLDQEGRLLPALLREFSPLQIGKLVKAIQKAQPGIRGVEAVPPYASRQESSFALLEQMPSQGRSGASPFPIPAWMLSEGTRRITAILALLAHEPPPTLLCIEEIENGLDPWSALAVLEELRSASRSGIQVVVTTHSPWLLDFVEVDEILHVERTAGDTVYARFADREGVKAYLGRVSAGAI